MRRMVIILLGAAISGQWSTETRAVQGEDAVAAPPAAGGSHAWPAELKALVKTRGALHSGVCRASWKWSTNTSEEEGQWKCFSDYDKGLSRIDRDVTTTVYHVPPTGK